MDEAKQSIQIAFRGDPVSITYEDIVAYQLGSGFVGVQTKEGKMYIYPADRIESVIYTQE